MPGRIMIIAIVESAPQKFVSKKGSEWYRFRVQWTTSSNRHVYMDIAAKMENFKNNPADINKGDKIIITGELSPNKSGKGYIIFADNIQSV